MSRVRNIHVHVHVSSRLSLIITIANITQVLPTGELYGVVLVSKIKFDMHHKLICNSIGILCWLCKSICSSIGILCWLCKSICIRLANRSVFRLANRSAFRLASRDLHFDWQIAICISIGKSICILICVSICKLCWITKSTCSSVCILPIYNLIPQVIRQNAGNGGNHM